MRRELPSFSAMRAFEASARHASFKRAAEELCVTQSAISHQIRLLEDYLGLPMFYRGVREVILTREGSDYYADLSRNLEQMSAATARIRDTSERGPLSIRSTPAFASRWLIPRLSSLQQQYPGLELHISTSVECADFNTDGVDVDIRWRKDASRDIQFDTLLTSTRFPVASPRLLTGRPSLRRPNDLQNFTLLHDETTNDWQRWLALAGGSISNANEGPHFAHCDLLLQAVIDAQGVGLAYDVLVQADLAAGRLIKLFDIALPPARVYFIAVPRAWRDRPKIRAFRNWLLAEAQPRVIRTPRPAVAMLGG